MFSETARRIKEGLLSSVEGGTLQWLQGYQAVHPLSAETLTADSPRTPGGDSASIGIVALGQSGEKSSTPSESSAVSGASALARAVSKKEHHFIEATAFLKDGFEELLKCRCVSPRIFSAITLTSFQFLSHYLPNFQILQWSYPYAFFEFEHDDHGDYSRFAMQQFIWKKDLCVIN